MNKHISKDQLFSHVCRTLTDAQREVIDTHLRTCPECRARLAQREALHRRIHYGVMDRRRHAAVLSQSTFADIAPRLQRSRRIATFWKGSIRFVYTLATLAVLIVLVVGLFTFFGGIGQLPIGPVMPAAAPTPGPRLATSPEDIVGQWQGAGLYYQFNQNGTFFGALSPDELEDQPNIVGEFWFEGTQLFIWEIEFSGKPNPCESNFAIYEVQLLGKRHLRFSKIEDDCPLRVRGIEGEWYEPYPR
jgi:hypothetical protein